MTKKHIYIYKNKKTQEVFADLLELSCLYLKRILEMKERKVQTLFVEGKPEPALASALLQARAMGLNVVIKLKTTESNSETQEEFKEHGLDDVVMA